MDRRDLCRGATAAFNGAVHVALPLDAGVLAGKEEATERARKMGVSDKVEIRQGDLFEADIKDATVVTLYLLRSLNVKLMPKLQSDLKPGARIVSQTFNMGEAWPPEKTIEVDGRPVYLWTIK